MKKAIRNKSKIILLLFLILIVPNKTFGHSGATDSYGGHENTLNGTYHCHSGKCLDDARKKAFDFYFPIGQQDGLIGVNKASEIPDKLNFLYDGDKSSYWIPYSLEAYDTGYKDTYTPTFVESYGWYIMSILILSILLIVGIKIMKRARHSKDAKKNSSTLPVLSNDIDKSIEVNRLFEEQSVLINSLNKTIINLEIKAENHSEELKRMIEYIKLMKGQLQDKNQVIETKIEFIDILKDDLLRLKKENKSLKEGIGNKLFY